MDAGQQPPGPAGPRPWLPWPLPALLVWASAWAWSLVWQRWDLPAWAVLSLGTAWCALCAAHPLVAASPWRRVMVSLGYALSLAALTPARAWPAWVWLLPLLVLLLAYPLRAWHDAPVFPTPKGALVGLPGRLALGQPPGWDGQGARILDAGCGMGDAMRALHQAYPQADIHGVEWSPLWRWVAALRCPWAQVRQGDMWAQSWREFDMVYLFQRPESMPKAVRKAAQELGPQAWLVSLEFEARDEAQVPMPCAHRIDLAGGRALWLYRPASWALAAQASTPANSPS